MLVKMTVVIEVHDSLLVGTNELFVPLPSASPCQFRMIME